MTAAVATTIKPETSPLVVQEPLTIKLTDVCDNCGYTDYVSTITGSLVQVAQSQAFVAVRVPSGSVLKFCGHHYTQHEAKFVELGYQVADHRHLINEKNASSAFADGQEAADLD